MERDTKRNGALNLFTLLLAGIAGYAVARYANSLAGQVGMVFVGVGVLVAAVSWFQMRLEDRERLEKLEFDELTKGKGGSTLFESKDAEAFPAQRSREQFERFFVPVFTVLLLLLQTGAALFFYRHLAKVDLKTDVQQATMALSLFAVFALILFILGKFTATMARMGALRLLRPGAAYVLLGAYLCFTVTLGIVGVEAGFPKADFYLAKGLCVLLGLVAVETLINLVLEIYRPRIKGKVGRPLYESRLVGLLGQPEGLITTAAQALDYQFGFKVSDTWFYRFFEKALGWLLLLQAGILLLSTCLVVIDAGEQGLLERFGKPVAGRTVLEPGAHLKLPWPMDRVYRYRTEQIQSFIVGSVPDPNKEKERLVLWTVAHTKEENFLVASRDQGYGETNRLEGKRTPPVSLMVVSIPVQYQITNLVAWAYNNEDPGALLQDEATREVVRFLAGADLANLMSSGRLKASQTLLALIQKAADERKLGAKVISVGLQDLHPPVKVAPDYEKVIGALQTKQAKILAARADDIKTNALAEALSVALVNGAEAQKVAREMGALSQAALFQNQVPAFQAAPAVYAQRSFLQTFTRATAGARKYVLLTTNTQDVLTFDLQEKIRQDLFDLSVPAAKK
jgi:modulator of FtsH protease HflK